MAERAKWPQWRIETAVAFLEELRSDAVAGMLPSSVYEALMPLAKKVSTELVIFDDKHRIFMIRRPSLEENPAEPFPSQWHAPGVTHRPDETDEQAWARLIRTEVGEDAQLSDVRFIAKPDIYEPMRGMYKALIHTAQLTGGQVKHHAHCGFFAPGDLPQPMVFHHEKTIIPVAIRSQLLS